MLRCLMVAILVVGMSLLAATCRAEEPLAPAAEHLFSMSVGVQVSQSGDAETSGIFAGGYFALPKYAPWVPTVLGLSFTMPGANKETDPEDPPDNVFGVEAWWSVLETPFLDVAPGAGLTFGNFALEDTEPSLLYGLSLILKKEGTPKFMVSILDYKNLDRWDLELTGRVAMVVPFDL